MSDAFVLGAGFSMAIDSAFPSTDQLGTEAVEILVAQHNAPPRMHSSICDGISCDRPVLRDGAIPTSSANFETWLTRLAEQQPHLLPSENALNDVLFSELASAIETVLRIRQDTALGREPPEWLVALVRSWHERQADILTFNYDTLVEATIDYLGAQHNVRFEMNDIDSELSQDFIGPTNLLIPVAWSLGTDQVVCSLSLYKLHGSLNWYWDDATRSPQSMINVCRAVRGWGDIEPDLDLATVTAGRAPVIVPPTLSKNAFFNNTTLRTTWRRAFEALRQADRLFIAGYSMPPGDHLVASMLGAAFDAKQKEVFVINLDDDVAHRVHDAGAEKVNTDFCGPDGMVRFVDWYVVRK